MELLAANVRLPPGFGFNPTDIDLVMHYLKKKLQGKPLEPELVAEVDIYQFHPKDLRERAAILSKNSKLYFFCALGKKFSCGDRKKRATEFGYWKATGKHRIVSYRRRTVGKVRTLVFHHYQGKPRKAERTDWVMHEYTLEDTELGNKEISADAFVLCKVFKKGGPGPRNGEQYGAPYNEEEWNEEEISNNAVNGSVSVMADSANAYPLQSPEQVYSGAVSVSAVYQAPTPTSGLANVASTSKTDADGFGGIFDNLEDLGGIELDDLLTPLGT